MKDLNILLNFLGNKPFEQVKEELSKKPYCIDFDETLEHYLMKYNMINSDMSNPIVQLCRGIIFEKNTNRPVCIPFYKFFNYGENLADKVDWNNARVQKKIDGSIVKFWYDHKNCVWRISTNGKINANECQVKDFDFTFEKLFKNAITEYFEKIEKICNSYIGLDFDNFIDNIFKKNYTYLFELVSPYNRIVINYPETKIYHIGTRSNVTFEELDVDIGIEKPKEYPLKSLDDCIKAASILKEDKEGYVVVDKDWSRIKIKSPLYIQFHHQINNGAVTKRRLIEMIQENIIDDFIGMFPEFGDDIDKIKFNLLKLEVKIVHVYFEYFDDEGNCKVTKKELALGIKDRCKQYSGIIFNLYDKKFKIEDISKYLLSQKITWLEEVL